MSTFKIGDSVKKKSGSSWEGRIVGTYSTELTPEGYAVESFAHKGSVQIYPANALELLAKKPSVREPLSDEQIAEMAKQEEFLLIFLIFDDLDALTEIVRSVERHHGIGVKGEAMSIEWCHRPASWPDRSRT